MSSTAQPDFLAQSIRTLIRNEIASSDLKSEIIAEVIAQSLWIQSLWTTPSDAPPPAAPEPTRPSTAPSAGLFDSSSDRPFDRPFDQLERRISSLEQVTAVHARMRLYECLWLQEIAQLRTEQTAQTDAMKSTQRTRSE